MIRRDGVLIEKELAEYLFAKLIEDGYAVAFSDVRVMTSLTLDYLEEIDFIKDKE